MPAPTDELDHVAYVGLGANLGDREATIRSALDELGRRPDVRVVRVSSLVETEPVGGPPQGRFINGAAELRTSLAPEALLRVLQEAEARAGRRRTVRWGPRALDLDLLLYDDAVVDLPDLRVPHPLMHERRFVLEPLCQIAPAALHPILRKTVRELLATLDG
jgi:2-amino-4-hydroxy-6-hydroxymethyldihydropteridine diphosphokinase